MLPTSSLSRQTKRYRPRNATTQEAQELHTYCVEAISGISPYPLSVWLVDRYVPVVSTSCSLAYLLKAQLCVSHDTVLQPHGHPPLHTTHDVLSPTRYMILHSIQGFHPYLLTVCESRLRFASVSRARLDNRPLLASGRVTLVELQRVRAPPPQCSARDYLILVWA
jgi:hypothetical protein